MNTSTYLKRSGFFFKLAAWVILVAFGATGALLPHPSYAQNIFQIPSPKAMLSATPGYVPSFVKALVVHPDNPFQFDFVIDTGHSKLTGDALEEQTKKLVRYFLATVTVPDNDQWVNLSPYEKDRIIPDEFAKTEMGQELLAQDFILKQMTASLMHPEGKVGEKFWKKIRARAKKELGATEIPVDVFNKVWIMPDAASVYEEGNVAIVTEARLKVMLEKDYLADSFQPTADSKNDNLSEQLIREIIVPELEREVNEGKHFAPLRQIYYSMILASWYKDKIKGSILNEHYANQNKVKGIDLSDTDAKDKIYTQYLEAFKKGAYDFIKEDYDPETQEITAHRYFAGGITAENLDVGEGSATEAIVPAQGRYVQTGVQVNNFSVWQTDNDKVLQKQLRKNFEGLRINDNAENEYGFYFIDDTHLGLVRLLDGQYSSEIFSYQIRNGTIEDFNLNLDEVSFFPLDPRDSTDSIEELQEKYPPASRQGEGFAKNFYTLAGNQFRDVMGPAPIQVNSFVINVETRRALWEALEFDQAGDQVKRKSDGFVVVDKLDAEIGDGEVSFRDVLAQTLIGHLKTKYMGAQIDSILVYKNPNKAVIQNLDALKFFLSNPQEEGGKRVFPSFHMTSFLSPTEVNVPQSSEVSNNRKTKASFRSLEKSLDKNYSKKGRVWLLSNEFGIEDTLQKLRDEPRASSGVHIGVAGFLNLDIMAVRRPDSAVLTDINDHMVETFQILRTVLMGPELLDQDLTTEQKRKKFVELFIEVLRKRYMNNYFVETISNQEGYENTLRTLPSNPNSWLGTDEGFEHVQKMFLDGNVAIFRMDWTDVVQVKKLSEALAERGLSVDTLYVSNVKEFYDNPRRGNSDFIADYETMFDLLASSQTLIIEAPRLSLNVRKREALNVLLKDKQSDSFKRVLKDAKTNLAKLFEKPQLTRSEVERVLLTLYSSLEITGTNEKKYSFLALGSDSFVIYEGGREVGRVDLIVTDLDREQKRLVLREGIEIELKDQGQGIAGLVFDVLKEAMPKDVEVLLQADVGNLPTLVQLTRGLTIETPEDIKAILSNYPNDMREYDDAPEAVNTPDAKRLRAYLLKVLDGKDAAQLFSEETISNTKTANKLKYFSEDVTVSVVTDNGKQRLLYEAVLNRAQKGIAQIPFSIDAVTNNDGEGSSQWSENKLRILHREALSSNEDTTHQDEVYFTPPSAVRVGEYRNVNPLNIRVLHHEMISQQMQEFVAWLNYAEENLNPEKVEEFIAEAFIRFIEIHPFEDGNGRTGRSLINLLLARYGRTSIDLSLIDWGNPTRMDAHRELENQNINFLAFLLRKAQEGINTRRYLPYSYQEGERDLIEFSQLSFRTSVDVIDFLNTINEFVGFDFPEVDDLQAIVERINFSLEEYRLFINILGDGKRKATNPDTEEDIGQLIEHFIGTAALNLAQPSRFLGAAANKEGDVSEKEAPAEQIYQGVINVSPGFVSFNGIQAGDETNFEQLVFDQILLELRNNSDLRIQNLADVLEEKRNIAGTDQRWRNDNFQSVLRELRKNALRGIRLSDNRDGKIIFTIERMGNEIVISVQDNGIGLSDVDESRLGESGYTSKAGEAKETDGRGIAHIKAYLSQVFGNGAEFSIGSNPDSNGAKAEIRVTIAKDITGQMGNEIRDVQVAVIPSGYQIKGRLSGQLAVVSGQEGLIIRSQFNILNAEDVPWDEVVRDLDKARNEFNPDNPNHRALQKNLPFVRKEFLKLLQEMKYMKDEGSSQMDLNDFKEYLKTMRKYFLTGVDGKSIYRPGTFESAPMTPEAFREFAALDSRIELIQKSLDKYIELIGQNEDFSLEELVDVVWGFYEAAMTVSNKADEIYIWNGGNNSLFMNMVNGLLRLQGLKGVSHHSFDYDLIGNKNPNGKKEFLKQVVLAQKESGDIEEVEFNLTVTERGELADGESLVELVEDEQQQDESAAIIRRLMEVAKNLNVGRAYYKELMHGVFGIPVKRSAQWSVDSEQSKQGGEVAIFEGLRGESIAELHEVGEYLGDKQLQFEFEGEELLIEIRAGPTDTSAHLFTLTRTDALLLAQRAQQYRKSGDATNAHHYFIRALQRQMFGERDVALSNKISVFANLSEFRIFNEERSRFIFTNKERFLEMYENLSELDSASVNAFVRVLPELEQKKNDLDKEYVTNAELFNDCATYTTKAAELISKTGLDAKIVTKTRLVRPEYANTYFHTFFEVKIGDQWFIVDLTAGQFALAQMDPFRWVQAYPNLGVVVLPKEYVEANADTFWMYTTGEEEINILNNFMTFKDRENNSQSATNIDRSEQVERQTGEEFGFALIGDEQDSLRGDATLLLKSSVDTFENLRAQGLSESSIAVAQSQWLIQSHPSSLYHDLNHSRDAAAMAYYFAKARGLPQDESEFLYRVGLLHDFDPGLDRGANTGARVPSTLERIRLDLSKERSLDGQRGKSLLLDEWKWTRVQALQAMALIARSEFPFTQKHPNNFYTENNTSPIAQYEELLKELQDIDPEATLFVLEEAPYLSEFTDKATAALLGGFAYTLTSVNNLVSEINIKAEKRVFEFQPFTIGNYESFWKSLGQPGYDDVDQEIAHRLGFDFDGGLFINNILEILPDEFAKRYRANMAAFQKLAEISSKAGVDFLTAVKAAYQIYLDSYLEQGASVVSTGEDEHAWIVDLTEKFNLKKSGEIEIAQTSKEVLDQLSAHLDVLDALATSEYSKMRKVLAINLQNKRESDGITMDELSARSGISIATISNIEANKDFKTPTETIQNLFKAFRSGSNVEDFAPGITHVEFLEMAQRDGKHLAGTLISILLDSYQLQLKDLVGLSGVSKDSIVMIIEGQADISLEIIQKVLLALIDVADQREVKDVLRSAFNENRKALSQRIGVEIGQILRQKRQSLGLNMNEVQRKSSSLKGVNISSMETGLNLNRGTAAVRAYAIALGTTEEDILNSPTIAKLIRQEKEAEDVFKGRQEDARIRYQSEKESRGTNFTRMAEALDQEYSSVALGKLFSGATLMQPYHALSLSKALGVAVTDLWNGDDLVVVRFGGEMDGTIQTGAGVSSAGKDEDGIFLTKRYREIKKNYIGEGASMEVYRHPTDQTKVVKIFKRVEFIKNVHINRYVELYDKLMQDDFLKAHLVPTLIQNVRVSWKSQWGMVQPFMKGRTLQDMIDDADLDVSQVEELIGLAQKILNQIDQVTNGLADRHVDPSVDEGFHNFIVIDNEDGSLGLVNIDPIDFNLLVDSIDEVIAELNQLAIDKEDIRVKGQGERRVKATLEMVRVVENGRALLDYENGELTILFLTAGGVDLDKDVEAVSNDDAEMPARLNNQSDNGVSKMVLAGGARLLSSLSQFELEGMVGAGEDEPSHIMEQKGQLTLGRGGRWGFIDTGFKELNARFKIIKQIRRAHELRKDPSEVITIVDWGAGDGTGLIELYTELKRLEKEDGIVIPNIQLVGYADKYQDKWQEAPEGITFIFDVAGNLPKHLANNSIDFMYSSIGLIHFLDEASPTRVSRHMKQLHQLMKAGREIHLESVTGRSGVVEESGFIIDSNDSGKIQAVKDAGGDNSVGSGRLSQIIDDASDGLIKAFRTLDETQWGWAPSLEEADEVGMHIFSERYLHWHLAGMYLEGFFSEVMEAGNNAGQVSVQMGEIFVDVGSFSNRDIMVAISVEEILERMEYQGKISSSERARLREKIEEASLEMVNEYGSYVMQARNTDRQLFIGDKQVGGMRVLATNKNTKESWSLDGMTFSPLSSVDSAKRAVGNVKGNSKELGGIDLTRKNLDLDVTSSSPIKFQYDPKAFENIQIDGLVPVIINMTPIPSLYPLLGRTDPDYDVTFPEELAYIKNRF